MILLGFWGGKFNIKDKEHFEECQSVENIHVCAEIIFHLFTLVSVYLCMFRRSIWSNLKQKFTFQNFILNFSYSYKRPTSHRPRMLLAGEEGQGQTSHLGPAVLHHLEQLPVHVLDLPALYAISAKTPEESCATVIFRFLLCHFCLQQIVAF